MLNVSEVEVARSFMPKQLETLEAIKTHKFVLYSGSVRSGKTLLLVNAAIRTALEYPTCNLLIATLTNKMLFDVCFTLFIKELALYQDAVNKAGYTEQLATINRSVGNLRVTFANGSVVLFRCCDSEEKLRGLTLDACFVDEVTTVAEEIYDQLLARISGGVVPNPFIMLATNPDSKKHFIYKRYYVTPTKKHYIINTTTYDNLLLPNYEDYIQEKEAVWNSDWINRMLQGKWGAFSGMVYKEFSLKDHVGNFTDNAAPRYQEFDFKYYACGVDFGIRNQTAIVVLGITRTGKAVLVYESYLTGKTSPQTVKQLVKLHKDYKFRKIFCDPSAADLILQCKAAKLPIYKGNNDVTSGIAHVSGIIMQGNLLVDKKCENFLDEVQSYRWSRDKVGVNLTEVPVKLDDHLLDALRYLLTGIKLHKGKTILGIGFSTGFKF